MKLRLAGLLVMGTALVGFGGDTSIADDLKPPMYRGLPGSTYSHWTYDEDAPGDPVFPRLDAPEESSFVSHPGWGDPESLQEIYLDEFEPDFPGLDFTDNFSWQLWAEEPGWEGTFMGRDGVLTDFDGGSWDINNFIDLAPVKFVRLQITWKPMDLVPGEFFFELEWFDEAEDVEEFVEDFRDPFEDAITLADGWIHSTFDFVFHPNPDVEFIGLFPDELIAIDQVVIDTISIPEPATWLLAGIALCGLGGLGRRRQR